MTNIFSKTDASQEDKVETDYTGGGGLFDTDLYSGKIKYAYLHEFASGAKAINLSVMVDGRELRQSIFVMKADGSVTYKDSKTGKPRNFAGYNQVNALCMLIAGKELGSMEFEDRTLSLWDNDAKAEKPKSVNCLVELHDQDIQLAVQQIKQFKQTKGDDGNYHDTDETQNINEIQKFFPAAKAITLSEVQQHIESLGGTLDDILNDGDMPKAIASYGDDQGPWIVSWLERNRGNVYDKTKGKSGGSGKSFGGDSGGAAKKKASLFD